MAYIVLAYEVIRDTDLVAVLKMRHRGVNSHVLLSDGSVTKSRTRANTFRRMLQTSGRSGKGLVWINDRRKPN